MALEGFDRLAAVFHRLDLCSHFSEDFHRYHCVYLVVLRHQDVAAPESAVVALLRLLRRDGGARCGGLFRHRQVQEHGEVRAFAECAVHDDFAAHQAHELVGDGHAETGTAELFAGFDALLLERTENAV